MERETVRLRMWTSGAYALASAGADGTVSLVEHDGRGALHTIDIAPDGFEETVIRRRVEASGVVMRRSRLRGDSRGNVEWERQLDSPRITRTDVWSAPAVGPGRWTREDVRPGRTTRYIRHSDGSFRAAATAPDGTELWTADWQRNRGRLHGAFFRSDGNALGDASVKGGGQQTMQWTGPDSQGTSSRTYKGADDTVVEVKDYTQRDGAHVHIVRTYEPTLGRGHETGSSTRGVSEEGINPAKSWIKIDVNDDKDNPMGQHDDGHSSVEFGTESNPDGTSTEYTISRHEKPDGSSSMDRTDWSSNGDTGSAASSTDVNGNTSTTEVARHADGSYTIKTRTVDKNGNGTEQTDSVDKDGKITNGEPKTVKGGKIVAGPTAGNADGSEGSDDSGDGDHNDNADSNVADNANDSGPPDDDDHPDPDADAQTGLPAGDGDDGDQEGNPDGRLAGMDRDTLLALVGRAWRGEEGVDSLGDTNARYGRWLGALRAVVAAGGTIGSTGEELDSLGAPIPGFDFSGGGGSHQDEDLDSLGRPVIDLDIVPRPRPGPDGMTRLGSLLDLCAQLAAGSATVAVSVNLLRQA